MKPSEKRTWSDIARVARGDTAPSRNIGQLMATLRQARAASASTPHFTEVFVALFATPRAMGLCGLATAVCATIVVQQAWAAWTLFRPWLDFIGTN